MKTFLFIAFLIWSLMNPVASIAADGEALDAGGAVQPKASGITVVPVHSKSPLKSSAPMKKEKTSMPQTQPASNPDSSVSDATGSTPPGLAKKGKLPKGLQKKDKIPSGWEKGKKQGWEKDKSGEVKESIFERKAREKLEKEQAKKDKELR